MVVLASGGVRARSGPPPDPMSFRSESRDWLGLPAGGFAGEIPEFPLAAGERYAAELALWDELWRKPQGFAWSQLGLKFQVAAYVRAFLESVTPDASAGLKTAVLRMETELGISIAGMRQNGWNISAPEQPADKPLRGGKAKQTSTGTWMAGVTVDGT